jgi:integrase
VVSFEDFDRYCDEHDVQPGKYGAAFAQWLANVSGETIIGGPANGRRSSSPRRMSLNRAGGEGRKVKAAGFVATEGKASRRIYDLRHTYATMSLAAGVSLFTLARRMGTSVDMIARTYGRLAPDAEAYERELLDAWDARPPASGQLAATDGSY